jgi:HK97 family phage portal protein
VADTSGSVELVRVSDRRHSAELQRGFPRVPRTIPNDGGALGEVAPASPAGDVMGAESYVTSGNVPPTASPVPTAQPWSGWPAEWGTGWQSPAQLQSRVSTVFSCVRVNSLAIATMTPQLLRGRFPLTRGAEGWRSWLLNPQPELYSGMDELLQQLDASLEMRGNAYVMPTSEYRDGYPRTFFVMDPDKVTPRLEDGVRRLYDNHGRDITGDGVLHLRYLSVPGQAAGIGPLQGASASMVSAAALEQYAANLALQGGIPWGVLESETRMSPTQARLARDEYVASRQARTGAPAFLPYGMKLHALTLSPKDMALLDLRVFDEQRISGAFGVHPSMVNLPAPEGLTYSNRVDLRTEHYLLTLRPTASKVANAFSQWALPGFVQLRLNASEYLQGTVRDRVETYLPLATAVDPTTGRPIITGEELRELIGLPPGGPDLTATLDALAQTTSGTQ